MEDQTNGPATRVREEGALELAESKSMKPYMDLTIANDPGPRCRDGSQGDRKPAT
jgi:hypothetical protein